MTPRFLLAYQSSTGRKFSRYFINQEKTETKGVLSEISKRKIKRAVDNLMLIAEPKKVYTDQGEPFTFKINFITLVLPSKQIHTDKELKALLNDWLKIWSRKGLKSYVWKAEKQKNGNLHFHLTTDFYIHYSDIRKSWNACLSRIGYIESYRSAQIEWHKKGFKVRTDVKRLIRGKMVKWDRSAQFKAYKQGVTENWSNPNTTDVHSVRNIRDISAYICEYITKNKGDKVNGRLWGCSRNLLIKPRDLDGIECREAFKYIECSTWKSGFRWQILPIRYIKSTLLENCVSEYKAVIKGEIPESCPLKLEYQMHLGQLTLMLPPLPEISPPPNPMQLKLFEI